MSDFKERYPLNVSGKYYVTAQCTDCDLCRETAPNNIQRDDRTGVSYVFRQPATQEEIARVEEGVGGCPTDAVGNDGDNFDWETTPILDWNALYQKEAIRFDVRAPIIGIAKPAQPWWSLS